MSLFGNSQFGLTNSQFGSIRWRSDLPLTKEDLKKMRDEFWDTAYAYEGQKHVWDTLKECIDLIHLNQSDTAQMILVESGITIPNGDLSECYDTTGVKYELPNFVISDPTNVMSLEAKRRKELESLKLNNKECSSAICETRDTSRSYNLKLSNDKALKIKASQDDTVLVLKRQVEQFTKVPVTMQRWYFAGKALDDDVQIINYGIRPNYVIQVIIHKPVKPPDYDE